jgi:hypothetical protein
VTVPAPVRAPWTDDQAASLNAFQRSGMLHPFTCAAEGCREVLAASPSWWACPEAGCGYVQDWAHPGMADWSWQAGWDPPEGAPGDPVRAELVRAVQARRLRAVRVTG